MGADAGPGGGRLTRRRLLAGGALALGSAGLAGCGGGIERGPLSPAQRGATGGAAYHGPRIHIQFWNGFTGGDGPFMQKLWLALGDHPIVGEARMVGLIGALELTPNKAARASWPVETGTVGMIARDFSFANGLVMRATRDTLIIAPPLVISHGEVEELIAAARKTLDETYAEVKRRGYV